MDRPNTCSFPLLLRVRHVCMRMQRMPNKEKRRNAHAIKGETTLNFHLAHATCDRASFHIEARPLLRQNFEKKRFHAIL